MTTTNNKRNSNIEILRVLSMIGIVILHYIYHGLKSKNISIFNGSWISFLDYSFMETLYVLTSTSVNCYVLISGYFLITKSNHRFHQLLKLWFQVLFYSIIIGLTFNFSSGTRNITHIFFPIYNNQYWFITSYFGLILISPYISSLVSLFSKKQYLVLILILCIISLEPFYGKVYANFDSILYFILLFLIGGYFRLYNIPHYIKRKIKLLTWGTLLSFSFLAIIFSYYQYTTLSIPFELKSTAYNNVILILSIFIFIFFTSKDLIPTKNNTITKLAPYTLGVYLIHDNQYIRSLLWNYIIPEQFNTYIILHCLYTSIMIFSSCIIIEYIRCLIFQKLQINKFIDILYNKFQLIYQRLSLYVKNKRIKTH